MRCYHCGRSVEESRRFCTNCGRSLDNDEAVVRIVEEGPVMHSGYGFQNGNLNNTTPLSVILKKHKKKLLAGFAVLTIIVGILGLVNLFKTINKKEYKYDGEFVLMTKSVDGKNELYLGVPGKEEVKLASYVADAFTYNYILTGFNGRKYIYLSSDGELYEVDDTGSSEKIAAKVDSGYILSSPDLKKYIFVTADDNTLYLKENNKEKLKIDEEVISFFFMEDNETVAYIKENNELFIRGKNGKTEKISENVNHVFPFFHSDALVYIKDNSTLYYKHLRSGDEMALTGKAKDGMANFFNGLSDFNGRFNLVYKNDKDLYYFDMGKREPAKIASGVEFYRTLGDIVLYNDLQGQWKYLKIGTKESHELPNLSNMADIKHNNGYLLYTTSSGELHRIKIKDGEEEKIYESVMSIYTTEKGAYFLSTIGGRNLYKLEKDGQVTKIQEDIVDVQIVDNSYLTYTTADKELYIDGKVYSNVSRYAIAGKNICYINSDNEMYLIEGKSEPKKISDDISQYSKIYFGGQHLFAIDYLRELPIDYIQ